MTIQSFMFSPSTLSIRMGDRIRVTNKDSAPHTFTDQNGSFDSGRLSQDQSKTLTFTAKGNFDFYCSVHPVMTGTLRVTA